MVLSVLKNYGFKKDPNYEMQYMSVDALRGETFDLLKIYLQPITSEKDYFIDNKFRFTLFYFIYLLIKYFIDYFLLKQFHHYLDHSPHFFKTF